MTLGEKIKKLRKTKGLTQTQFANQFNVSYGAIAMWETDKREPDLETMIKLSKFFEVSIDDMLGQKHPQPTGFGFNLGLSAYEENLVNIIADLDLNEQRQLISLVENYKNGLKCSVLGELTKEEIELIQNYRLLDDKQKLSVKAVMKPYANGGRRADSI